MQNEINMFILNMAAADLIASIVLPPTFLVTNVFQAYMLGPWWCKYGGTVRCEWTRAVLEAWISPFGWQWVVSDHFQTGTYSYNV